MTARNSLARWLARWFMRAEAAGNILRIVFFGLTGLSTALFTLKQYGHQDMAWPFIIGLVGGTLAFMYVYAERGVLNQKNRDAADAGDNYSGPTMLMDRMIEGRQLAYLAYVLQNGDGNRSMNELEEDIQAITEEEWQTYRDGISIQDQYK